MVRAVGLLALGLGTVVLGQEQEGRFSAGVELVEVYATVTDGSGNLVTSLKQEDFRVFEDGEPQAIEAFAAGSFPLTVALGVDRSASMAGEPLRVAKSASQAFLRGLRDTDRSMVVAIGNEAEVIAPLSADRSSQLGAIAALDAWSTTALHDAIVASLDRLEAEPGRQALVIFSDGADRYSRASAAAVVERARRSQTLIYPVAIGRTRPPVLVELAALTGGRSFQLRDIRQLESTLATIASELRFQYLIGYAPPDTAPAGVGQWRSIRVTANGQRPGLRVRARDGYIAR